MDHTHEILRVTDETLAELLTAECAILILAKTGCAACAGYEAELLGAGCAGRLGGVVVRKLVLDAPGAVEFKRSNPWLADVDFLPYTVLYVRGEPAEDFATSRSPYLLERLDATRAAGGSASPGEVEAAGSN